MKVPCKMQIAENVETLGKENQSVNNKPIVGILSQELSYQLNQKYPNRYDSYIASSYVKFIEEAGARVVPIGIGRNYSYYKDIMSKINGILLPGGTTYFYLKNGYVDAGEHIYKIATEFNKNENHFPILGICLGFELLTYLAADRIGHRTECDSMKQYISLDFTPDYNESRMFKNAPDDVIQILRTKNVTANFHRLCITTSGLERVNLTKKFRIMSLNKDKNGLEFISTIEHNEYPFYGLQFHPEKNVHERMQEINAPDQKDFTIVQQYFARFFVNEARKSQNKFEDQDEEKRALIHNYPITYTDIKSSTYEQCYLFDTS